MVSAIDLDCHSEDEVTKNLLFMDSITAKESKADSSPESMLSETKALRMGIMAKKCCIFSPRGEMQEPTEISIAVSACETTMLSVALFQSREITFEGIGGFRNRRVVKIVKHVRQSTEEHAARSFEITKNPPSFR